MALTTTELVAEVRAGIPEVPASVVKKYLMRAAARFCQETRAWRIDFQLSVTGTIATYDLENSFPSSTELVDVISIKNTGGGAPLQPRTYSWLDANLTDWRSDTALNANYYVLDGDNTIRLVPTPSVTTASLYDVRVAVKPRRTAASIDAVVMNHYDEELLHGTMALLYLIPRKPWTDLNLAQYHEARFLESLPTARAEATDEFQTGVPRKVKYGGL